MSDDGSPDVDPGMLAKLARPMGYLHPFPNSDDAEILDGKAREAQEYKQDLANRDSRRRDRKSDLEEGNSLISWITSLQNKTEELEEENASCKYDRRSIRKDNEKLQRQLQTTRFIEENQKKAIEQLENQLKDKNTKNKELETEVKSQSKAHKDLEGKLRSVTTAAADQRKKNQGLETRIERRHKDTNRLTEELQDKEELEAVQKTNQGLEARVERRNKDIKCLTDELEGMKTIEDQQKSKIRRLEKEKGNESTKIASLEKQIKTHENTIRDKREEFNELFADHEEKIKKANRILEEECMTIDRLRNERNKLQQQVDKWKKDNKQVNEALERLKTQNDTVTSQSEYLSNKVSKLEYELETEKRNRASHKLAAETDLANAKKVWEDAYNPAKAKADKYDAEHPQWVFEKENLRQRATEAETSLKEESAVNAHKRTTLELEITKGALSTTKDELATAVNAHKSTTLELEITKQTLDMSNSELESTKHELTTAVNAHKSITSGLEIIKQTLDKANSELETKKAALATEMDAHKRTALALETTKNELATEVEAHRRATSAFKTTKNELITTAETQELAKLKLRSANGKTEAIYKTLSSKKGALKISEERHDFALKTFTETQQAHIAAKSDLQIANETIESTKAELEFTSNSLHLTLADLDKVNQLHSGLSTKFFELLAKRDATELARREILRLIYARLGFQPRVAIFEDIALAPNKTWQESIEIANKVRLEEITDVWNELDATTSIHMSIKKEAQEALASWAVTSEKARAWVDPRIAEYEATIKRLKTDLNTAETLARDLESKWDANNQEWTGALSNAVKTADKAWKLVDISNKMVDDLEKFIRDNASRLQAT